MNIFLLENIHLNKLKFLLFFLFFLLYYQLNFFYIFFYLYLKILLLNLFLMLILLINMLFLNDCVFSLRIFEFFFDNHILLNYILKRILCNFQIYNEQSLDLFLMMLLGINVSFGFPLDQSNICLLYILFLLMNENLYICQKLTFLFK